MVGSRLTWCPILYIKEPSTPSESLICIAPVHAVIVKPLMDTSWLPAASTSRLYRIDLKAKQNKLVHHISSVKGVVTHQ